MKGLITESRRVSLIDEIIPGTGTLMVSLLFRTHLGVWCDEGMTLLCKLSTIIINITTLATQKMKKGI